MPPFLLSSQDKLKLRPWAAVPLVLVVFLCFPTAGYKETIFVMAAKFIFVLNDSLRAFLLRSHDCCFLPCVFVRRKGRGTWGDGVTSWCRRVGTTVRRCKDSSWPCCQDRLGSILPVCSGDKSSIRDFVDFSGQCGIEEGFLIGFGSINVPQFQGDHCPALSGTAVDDACRVGIISASFDSQKCPGVFETLHGLYTWSPVVGQGLWGSPSPEENMGQSVVLLWDRAFCPGLCLVLTNHPCVYSWKTFVEHVLCAGSESQPYQTQCFFKEYIFLMPSYSKMQCLQNIIYN